MADQAAGQPIGAQRTRTYFAEAAGTYTRGFGVVQGTLFYQCKVPAGAAAACLGVVAETIVAAIGDPISLIMPGSECIAMAGGILSAGMRVKMETEGDFVDGSAADVETAGIVRTAAAADGDEFVLEFMPIHKRS